MFNIKDVMPTEEMFTWVKKRKILRISHKMRSRHKYRTAIKTTHLKRNFKFKPKIHKELSIHTSLYKNDEIYTALLWKKICLIWQFKRLNESKKHKDMYRKTTTIWIETNTHTYCKKNINNAHWFEIFYSKWNQRL